MGGLFYLRWRTAVKLVIVVFDVRARPAERANIAQLIRRDVCFVRT
jgi:hypothetical protein